MDYAIDSETELNPLLPQSAVNCKRQNEMALFIDEIYLINKIEYL
jgi:hypothetical protein